MASCEHVTPRLVVGIGASAGGLEACRRLLTVMPPDSGMAFVIIMHLDPARVSHLAEIFGAATAMKVVQVTESMPLVRDHVYVIAPDTSLAVRDGVLQPGPPQAPHGSRKPVDALFSSLAADQRERAVAIVLSGTGSNGSLGIRDVRACGGLCLAQDPQTAEHDGMPASSIATGLVDEVLSPEEMPGALLEYAEHPGARREALDGEGAAAFEGILELLGQAHGVDFRTLYKRGTLRRRTERRMGLRQIADWQAYLELLRTDAREVAALNDDLLIDVTQFFRDPEVWEQVEQEVVPQILERHQDGTPIKIWVPGCASGEEAYSVAMLFLERLERVEQAPRLQVFATDVAEAALAQARHGVYPSSIQGAIAPARLARFFRRAGDNLRVRHDLRETVTFAVHNLLADPPFSGLDLISCRNVLIYLEAHAQQRILEVFHFGLRAGGLLLLGSSETVGSQRGLFDTVSPKARIYRPTAASEGVRYHLQWAAERPALRGLARPPAPAPRGPRVSRMIEQLVLGKYTWACVAVTGSFEIHSFYGQTQDYLEQPTGEARMDLLAWSKPGMFPRLRTGLERAREHNERVVITDMHVQRGGEAARVECTIEPITPLPGEARMYMVSFRDLPCAPATETKLAFASEEPVIRQLEVELRDAREELQSTIEQLETTNEEYRAGHEELLSLNEELQSNNEELEASKEELQSLNEELVTVNRQLEEKNIELRAVSTDLDNLLTSSGIPIIFLDRGLRVRQFTPAATELMRLVRTDVGRSVEHVKGRFDDPRLVDDAREVLDRLVPITAEVQTEDGRYFKRDILPYRTKEDRIDGVCVTFNDITVQKKAAREHEEARRSAEAFVSESPAALLVLDRDLRVVIANDAFCRSFQVSRLEMEGGLLFELGDRQWNIPRLRELLERVLPAKQDVRAFEVEHDFEHLGRRSMVLNARRMSRGDLPPFILLNIEDLTEHRRMERSLEVRAEELARDQRQKNEFLAMLGHELRNPLTALSAGVEILARAGQDPTRLGQVQAMMARQVRRITDLLDQLLDIARLTAGKIQMAHVKADLVAAARAGLEAAMPLIEARGHKLALSLPPAESVLVLGDPSRLVQVVENLLSNAAKYTEAGGKIWLSLESDERSARLSVRDTGVGMDAELLAHAFELFFQGPRTLDRAAGGLGLGLPLVKRVVEMHGGAVTASSPGPGQGCELVVTLPLMRERRLAPRTEGADAVQGEVQPHRILVVDDEEDCAAAVAEILSMHGHELRVAHDGPAALLEARTFHPELVLLDLGLPGMDGYEVAARLREQHRGEVMVLVALTGYQEDAERLRRAGFDRHVIKPADTATLISCLAPLDLPGS